TIGIRACACLTSSSARSKFIPCSSARCELAWITGPSAIGSENGSPSSMTSAPAPSSARMRSTVRAASGWPAVMYGTSARRPSSFSAAKRRAIALDEVVADADAIALGILGLDDRPQEHAVAVAVGEIDQFAGMDDVPLLVADHADDRP